MDEPTIANTTLTMTDKPNSFEIKMVFKIDNADGSIYTETFYLPKALAETLKGLTKAQVIGYFKRVDIDFVW